MSTLALSTVSVQYLRSSSVFLSEVQWKLPSQLVIARDALCQQVAKASLLRQHLCLDYLHGDVAAILNPSLAQSLGIHTLSTSHLMEIGKVLLLELEKKEVVGESGIWNSGS